MKKVQNIETGQIEQEFGEDWKGKTCKIEITGLYEADGETPWCSEKIDIIPNKESCLYGEMKTISGGMQTMLDDMKEGKMAADSKPLMKFTADDSYFSCMALTNQLMDITDEEKRKNIWPCATWGDPFPEVCAPPAHFCTKITECV